MLRRKTDVNKKKKKKKTTAVKSYLESLNKHLVYKVIAKPEVKSTVVFYSYTILTQKLQSMHEYSKQPNLVFLYSSSPPSPHSFVQINTL